MIATAVSVFVLLWVLLFAGPVFEDTPLVKLNTVTWLCIEQNIIYRAYCIVAVYNVTLQILQYYINGYDQLKPSIKANYLHVAVRTRLDHHRLSEGHVPPVRPPAPPLPPIAQGPLLAILIRSLIEIWYHKRCT